MITDTAYFLRDVYHPSQGPLAAYLNLWAKHSTATDTSYLDSRLSVVYRLTAHDQVRASAGSTTTQPSANMLGEQFIESPPRRRRRRFADHVRRLELDRQRAVNGADEGAAQETGGRRPVASARCGPYVES